MSSLVRGFLGERRKRMVGTLMQYIEAEINPLLDDRRKRMLRQKVLGASNEYHDSAVDLINAAVDDSSMMNEEALRVIARVDTELTRIRRDRNARALEEESQDGDPATPD